MTLTELRYIVAVAKEKHFGRAADTCFVSQPTLSVAIRKLETYLGVLIFERGLNEITVTPAGQPIIEQAQVILEEVARLKNIAEGGKNQLVGNLRLGAIYTIGPYLFPHLVPKLHKLAPQMPIEFQEDFTSNFRNKLRQGTVDVVIVALPFTEPGIVTLPLYEEPLLVLMPSKHPWTKKKFITPDLLTQENLLLLGSGHCLRDHILQLCPSCVIANNNLNKTATTIIEGSSLETIRHMVASGLGVSVLPSTAANLNSYAKNLLTVRPFAKPIPTRKVGLAWRNSFPRPKVIDAIRQALLACPIDNIKPLI